MQTNHNNELSLKYEKPRTGSLWSQSLHRLFRKKIAVVCIITISIMYLAGSITVFGSPTPYGYNEQHLTIEEVKQGPSLAHPFGTDRLGRDLLTRVIYGLRTTVIITLISLLTGSLILGISLGLISGYFEGWADLVIMRIGEIFLSFPGLLLVILIAATIKPRVRDWVSEWAPGFESFSGIDLISLGIVDYFVIFGAMSAFSWVGMARLVRGQVLHVKQSQYIEAARAMGASNYRILVYHVMPNIISPVIVLVSMGMGATAGSEIILSWLGIGIQPPTPSLGVMIFENGSIGVLRSDPHLIMFPIMTVTILIFAFNLLGDALNDALNPRAR